MKQESKVTILVSNFIAPYCEKVLDLLEGQGNLYGLLAASFIKFIFNAIIDKRRIICYSLDNSSLYDEVVARLFATTPFITGLVIRTGRSGRMTTRNFLIVKKGPNANQAWDSAKNAYRLGESTVDFSGAWTCNGATTESTMTVQLTGIHHADSTGHNLQVTGIIMSKRAGSPYHGRRVTFPYNAHSCKAFVDLS